jgi:hypothetical protein
MEKLWEIEDYLQFEGVFVNGLTDRPAHMDSYMTVIDFKILDSVDLEKFKPEEWQQAIEEWSSSDIPVAKLLASTMKRKLSLYAERNEIHCV